MSRSIEQVLDTCVTQLHSGDDLEEILAGHPDIADELRPMLAAAAWTLIDIPAPKTLKQRKPAFVEMVARRRRQVEVADGYVNELKAGVPVEELLESAPAEMQPVITAAWRMHTTAPPAYCPDKMEEGKARLMAMAAERRAQQTSSISIPGTVRHSLGELLGGLVPSPSAGRRVRTSAFAAATACMVLCIGLAGIGTAAASSLPGEAFYGVKLLGESAQMLFTFDPEVRADLSLRFSEKRLDEIRRLVEDGDEVPIVLVAAWLNGHNDAWSEIQALPSGEQQELAQALLASMAARAEIEGHLRESVDDPAGLEELLTWARTLADTAMGSAYSLPDAAATEVASPILPAVPLPIRRPLPPDEVSASEDAAAQGEPVPLVQPDLAIEPVQTDVADQEPPPIVQPAVARSDDEADDDDDATADEPAEPAEPPTEAPPPYIQPPIDSPTPGDGAGGDEGDEPGGGEAP